MAKDSHRFARLTWSVCGVEDILASSLSEEFTQVFLDVELSLVQKDLNGELKCKKK